MAALGQLHIWPRFKWFIYSQETRCWWGGGVGGAEADRLASLFLAWVFFSLGLRMKGNEGHWNRRHARVGHNIPKPNMYVFSFSVQNVYGGVQNMFIFSLCCLPRLLLVFRDSDKMYICPNLCPGVISFPLSAESFKNNGNNIFTTSLYPNTLRPSLLLPQRGDFYNSNFVFFLSTTISLHSFPQWFGLTLEF